MNQAFLRTVHFFRVYFSSPVQNFLEILGKPGILIEKILGELGIWVNKISGESGNIFVSC